MKNINKNTEYLNWPGLKKLVNNIVKYTIRYSIFFLKKLRKKKRMKELVNTIIFMNHNVHDFGYIDAHSGEPKCMISVYLKRLV